MIKSFEVRLGVTKIWDIWARQTIFSDLEIITREQSCNNNNNKNEKWQFDCYLISSRNSHRPWRYLVDAANTLLVQSGTRELSRNRLVYGTLFWPYDWVTERPLFYVKVFSIAELF